MKKNIYLGDRNTDNALKGKQCAAVISSFGKCIRGRNGNMLVSFKEIKTVVPGRQLRKLDKKKFYEDRNI